MTGFDRDPNGLPIARCLIVLGNSTEKETELWVEESYEQIAEAIRQGWLFLEVHRIMPITESNPQTVNPANIVTFRPMKKEG